MMFIKLASNKKLSHEELKKAAEVLKRKTAGK